jgi:Family of unknown function (DUF6516)
MSDLSGSVEGIVLSRTTSEYNVSGDRHTVRTKIVLTNGSRLLAYESMFYDTGRTKYSYQWLTATNDFIHRWDNAHPVDLPTSPHHQHVGSEENVQPSEPMTLEKVLAFIAAQLISS